METLKGHVPYFPICIVDRLMQDINDVYLARARVIEVNWYRMLFKMNQILLLWNYVRLYIFLMSESIWINDPNQRGHYWLAFSSNSFYMYTILSRIKVSFTYVSAQTHVFTFPVPFSMSKSIFHEPMPWHSTVFLPSCCWRWWQASSLCHGNSMGELLQSVEDAFIVDR